MTYRWYKSVCLYIIEYVPSGSWSCEFREENQSVEWIENDMRQQKGDILCQEKLSSLSSCLNLTSEDAKISLMARGQLGRGKKYEENNPRMATHI